MMKFAANLNWLFQDYALENRFAAAAAAGFDAVEMLFPYDLPANRLAHMAADAGLVFSLINAPAGDWAAGERGLAALAGREAEFRRAIAQALATARTLGAGCIHVMAGAVADEGDIDRGIETFVHNLRWAAPLAADAGVTLTIEPINARDMPHYLIHRLDQARDVIRAVGADAVALQFDVYHRQMAEGDVVRAIQASADVMAYVQIAGAPERSEPDDGELDIPHILRALKASGYEGFVGCEYRPRHGGFDWLAPLKAIGGT